MPGGRGAVFTTGGDGLGSVDMSSYEGMRSGRLAKEKGEPQYFALEW